MAGHVAENEDGMIVGINVTPLVDGRLGGREREAFARHARSCPRCTAELAALERLDRVAGGIPVPAGSGAGEPSELARRRMRAELLRRANELVLAGQAPAAPRSGLAASARGRLVLAGLAAVVVLAALAGAAGIATHLALPPRNPPAATATVQAPAPPRPPTFRLQAAPGCPAPAGCTRRPGYRGLPRRGRGLRPRRLRSRRAAACRVRGRSPGRRPGRGRRVPAHRRRRTAGRSGRSPDAEPGVRFPQGFRRADVEAMAR